MKKEGLRGYQDEKKPEPDRYGDLVLWKELIRKASEVARGVIFITDDAKDDWWTILNNERIGPRPELLDEFRSETGQELYIYGSEKFVEIAKERGKKISEKAVAELEAARTDRESESRAHDAARGVWSWLGDEAQLSPRLSYPMDA